MSILKYLYTIRNVRYYIHRCIRTGKIIYYNKRKRSIIKRIQAKGRLTIVFMPIYLSMWKYDKLVDKLLLNSDIDIYIIPLLYPSSTREYNMRLQTEMRAYFIRKGFPYKDGYDFVTNTWYDASELDPDIVVFTQPYNVAHRLFRLENFWNKSLFLYTPYGMVLEYIEGFYNSLLQNIAYKQFYPTIYNYNDAKELAYNKGDNVVVTGYLVEDEFNGLIPDFKLYWKQKDPNIKRIIWAPHHSINENDTLNYSTFLDMAEIMQMICRMYMGQIQVAFKPHPALKKKLYSIKGWGKEKTDAYYNQWQSMPNSTIAEHDYIGLFQTSHAMIHDCSSFMAEYLYVNNPVLYISKPDHLSCANELGRLCYDLHYHGNSQENIIDFIENVVINEFDYLASERREFVIKHLKQSGNSVADNIYREIVSLLNK